MKKVNSIRRKFYFHLSRNIGFCMILIAVALLIGMMGYHFFEHLPWIDAFLNASMILSGMGPVTPLVSHGAKIFAGLYALFSGLIFIALIALILTPNAHYLAHKMRLEDE